MRLEREGDAVGGPAPQLFSLSLGGSPDCPLSSTQGNVVLSETGALGQACLRTRCLILGQVIQPLYALMYSSVKWGY